MATIRQKRAFTKVVENGGIVSTAMVEAGFSPATAKTPQKLTESKGWKELVQEHLSDDLIAKRHAELLNSQYLDHMTFPLGPEFTADKEKYVKQAKKDGTKEKGQVLSDEEIKALLATVNCTVRRVVHGESARHVYFWSPDNKARKDAVDMAYKLKGNYAPEKSVNVNVEIEADDVVKKLAEQINAIHRSPGVSGNGTLPDALGDKAQDKERVG